MAEYKTMMKSGSKIRRTSFSRRPRPYSCSLGNVACGQAPAEIADGVDFGGRYSQKCQVLGLSPSASGPAYI